ncbi:hypothetical protein F4811DRAFT_509111 [Daldinia bambusicola]|nr:hypothetical protein F4811DRAFT_509111 [Daldinia bambusicola]
MADGTDIAYNIAAFLSALFLLEFGADKFIDHTAIVARHIGVPESTIALLTAGAEWEELVVVISALAQGRPSLAVANTVGSAISNVLGAFSLGLLFFDKDEPVRFDRSSRIYSLALLGITTLVTPIIHFPNKIIWLACGSFLIAIFGIYTVSVGWAISKGSLTAPEDSDDDSSDDSSSDEDGDLPHETQALLRRSSSATAPSQRNHISRHTLTYHVFYLLVGFLAVCLAGFVLSRAAINITDAIGISEVLIGVVILSIATTLPEKFISVISGHRGHAGILVATTTGSNVFLLSLCMGITMVNTSGEFDHGNVTIAELVVMWCATLAFTLTVWFNARSARWIGRAMLAAYIIFIVLEFSHIHRIPDLM